VRIWVCGGLASGLPCQRLSSLPLLLSGSAMRFGDFAELLRWQRINVSGIQLLPLLTRMM